MEQEWDQFNKKLQHTPKTTNVQETTEYHTSHQTQKISKSEPMSEQGTSLQNIEIIPTFLTSEIILKVTEIPPLDVFYSTLHKVVVRRQRKRRRVETPEIPRENEPMDIVWKDIPSNPAENLTKLSQFTGAYATATMDKATKVFVFLMEREERIAHLKQQLEIEKANVNKQAAEQIAQL